VCKHHWWCSSLRLAARNSSTISFYVRSIDLLSPWNIAIDRPAIPEATNPIPCKLVRLLDTGPDSLLTMFSIWGKEGDIKTTETESFRLLRLPQGCDGVVTGQMLHTEFPEEVQDMSKVIAQVPVQF
jgi:hypothetical protein